MVTEHQKECKPNTFGPEFETTAAFRILIEPVTIKSFPSTFPQEVFTSGSATYFLDDTQLPLKACAHSVVFLLIHTLKDKIGQMLTALRGHWVDLIPANTF
jgi:hypothetical protein